MDTATRLDGDLPPRLDPTHERLVPTFLVELGEEDDLVPVLPDLDVRQGRAAARLARSTGAPARDPAAVGARRDVWILRAAAAVMAFFAGLLAVGTLVALSSALG